MIGGMVDRITELREMHPPGELTNRELWRWRVEQPPERRWLRRFKSIARSIAEAAGPI